MFKHGGKYVWWHIDRSSASGFEGPGSNFDKE